MIQILGNPKSGCDGVTRREALNVGGLSLFGLTLPQVVDMNLPVEGIFHNLAIISIDKRYPGHAKKVMHAIWGLGQLAFTKIVIIVDKDVNVHDLREVCWKVGVNIDPKYDCLLTEGIADVLDFDRPPARTVRQAGDDATRKWAEEGYPWVWPDPCVFPAEVQARTTYLRSPSSPYGENAPGIRTIWPTACSISSRNSPPNPARCSS